MKRSLRFFSEITSLNFESWVMASADIESLFTNVTLAKIASNLLFLEGGGGYEFKRICSLIGKNGFPASLVNCLIRRNVWNAVDTKTA